LGKTTGFSRCPFQFFGLLNLNSSQMTETAMPPRRKSRVNESELSKGQLRKLNALRKSLGDDIGNRAFAEWLSSKPDGAATPSDKNARTISEALQPLIEDGKLRIPRGGYILRRGRGRIIIERPE
jgi:hypothetical protein